MAEDRWRVVKGVKSALRAEIWVGPAEPLDLTIEHTIKSIV